MGTYWAVVAVSMGFGIFYMLSAFVTLPEWLAPRRFPGLIGLVCAVLPERWGFVARRVLVGLLFFFVAGTMAMQALRLHAM
jgi:hypothetical protein